MRLQGKSARLKPRLFAAALFTLALPGLATATEEAEALLADAARQAEELAGLGVAAEPVETLTRLRGIVGTLRQVVEIYPSSDEALAILRREPLPWFDLGDADKRIRALSKAWMERRLDTVAAAAPALALEVEENREPEAAGPKSAGVLPVFPTLGAREEVKPPAPASSNAAISEAAPPPALPVIPATALPPAGSAETEAQLDLDRLAIRNIQARLLVSGYDPNGIDGVIGGGTRSALSQWQNASGIEATGYLNETQLGLLQAQTEDLLSAWLQDPENARLYEPPPPISLGPANLQGRWNFTSICGPKSKLGSLRITGSMDIRHVGANRYSGPTRQSQGFRGRFTGELVGRTLRGEVNWGLLIGRVRVQGLIADQSLEARGRDSNGCSFYTRKVSQ